MEIFGIPLQAFLGQLMLGLVNGSFYAMLSLGLAVIFGLLGIVNFAHGAPGSALKTQGFISTKRTWTRPWWSRRLRP